jgi:hypothetical protein
MRLDFLKIFIMAFILVSSLMLCLSCVPPNYRSKCKSIFIPLSSSTFTIDTGGKLDDKIIEQVFSSNENFTKANYLWFTDSVNPKFWEIMYSYSRTFYFDIFIDIRMLNMFTFVLTDQNTDSVLGYIKQIQKVEQPSESCYYHINGHEIINAFNIGTYNIYAFHNDTLVLRSIYPQIPDNLLHEFHEKWPSLKQDGG